MKIFIFSPNTETLFTPEQQKQLESAGELHLYSKIQQLDEIKELFNGNEERIIAIDPDFFDWKFPTELVEKIPKLKGIVLQTTSFSWLDVDIAAKHNIPVVNLRGFSSTAVAEWATMMTLAVARRLPLILKDNMEKDFDKHKGVELREKKAGVIGLGNIGSKIAENMQGLGMKVQYWSKNTRDDRFKHIELEELFKTSDVVLPALASNDETEKLITDEMIRSMKSNALLVSIVHHMYNNDLVLEMVKNGKLFGYAFEEEKPSLENYDGNVWSGPSLAWCTEDSMRKNSEQWVEGIIKAVKGEFDNKVN